MGLTQEKATYFWLRHLEGADPAKRTLVKWNFAYPDDQTTVAEITGFISEMNKLKNRGMGDAEAMKAVLDNGVPSLKVFKKKVEVATVEEKPKRKRLFKK